MARKIPNFVCSPHEYMARTIFTNNMLNLGATVGSRSPTKKILWLWKRDYWLDLEENQRSGASNIWNDGSSISWGSKRKWGFYCACWRKRTEEDRTEKGIRSNRRPSRPCSKLPRRWPAQSPRDRRRCGCSPDDSSSCLWFLQRIRHAGAPNQGQVPSL